MPVESGTDSLMEHLCSPKVFFVTWRYNQTGYSEHYLTLWQIAQEEMDQRSNSNLLRTMFLIFQAFLRLGPKPTNNSF